LNNRTSSGQPTKIYRILRRIYARAPFDGEGAYLYGGRWSSPGTRLSYTSEHQSLAMLEYFVHLDPDDAPDDLVLATAEVPAELPSEQIAADDLPTNWRETPAPPELARFGDEFVERAKCCQLIVPSVVAGNERNWLLNPRHPDFAKIVLNDPEPLSYDPRMFGDKIGRAPLRREKKRQKHKSK
jgi:RES domain-containing protein